MIFRKSIKQQITEAVLNEIPKSHRIYHEMPIEDVMFLWWYTSRLEGMRLTEEGATAFQLAEIEFYDHTFDLKFKSHYKFVLEVSKKIKCPYYLGVNKIENKVNFYIRLYDSKIAMMLGLYGTLQEYLDSIKVKND